MAIKIPSRNIYQINNPKVRDNAIDNVSVEQNVIIPNNEYEVNVYNLSVEEKGVNGVAVSKALAKRQSSSGGYVWVEGAYVSYSPKITNIVITIPKLRTNSCINKIYKDKNNDGVDNIKILLNCDIYNGSASCQIKGFNNNTVVKDITTNYGEPKNINKTFEPPKDISSSIGAVSVDITSTILSKNFIDTSGRYEELENEDVYSFKLSFISEYEKIEIADDDEGVGENTYWTIKGICEKTVLKNIEITVYGDTIGIDLTDGSTTFGSGNKPHSLSGNELLQDSGFVPFGKKNIEVRIGGELSSDSGRGVAHLEMFSSFNFSIGDNVEYNGETARIYRYYEDDGYYDIISTLNGSFYNSQQKSIIVTSEQHIIKETLAQNLANNVLTQYAKGKETATIRCSINDYYDENGEKVIDIKTNKMSFRLHDEVIPYVFGANGQDQPMSKYQDGTPKIFEVVGSNIIFDGAVWQELLLQEFEEGIGLPSVPETPEETELISFTIDGTTYQAEEGMTWEQWLESEYNVNNYSVILLDSVQTVFLRDAPMLYSYGLSYNDVFVPITDTIVEGRAYVEKLGTNLGGSN